MQDMYQTSSYKVTLDLGKNQSVQITAVDKNTFEIFQSEPATLQRIGSGALSAAFKQSNPQIKYSFTREGDVLALQVVLKMDFLIPVSEVILLSKIHQNSEYKYLVNDLKKELNLLQKDFEKLSHQNYQLHQVGSYTFQTGGSIFKTSLHEGYYFIEISGTVASDQENQESQGQSYGYVYDFLQDTIKFGINVKVIEGNQEENTTIFQENYQLRASNYSSYQTPFKLNFALLLKKAGELKIDQDSSVNRYLLMNGILISVTQLQ